MANADSIFSEVGDFLQGVAEDHGVPDDIREIIQARVELYAHCLQQFDGFYSCINIRECQVENFEEKCLQAEEFLRAAMQSWRDLGMSVTPKLHLLEDHAMIYMRKYGGLADFDEEFVERAHQIGKRASARSKYSSCHATQNYIIF